MSVFVLTADGFYFNEIADRRFRRIVTALGIPFLILAFLIPFLELVGLQEGGGDTTEERYISILPDAAIADKVEEPPPAEEKEPEPEPVREPPKPQPKPKVEEPPAPITEKPPPPQPTKEQLQQEARQVAQRAGINAFSDELAELRDNSLKGFDAARPLSDEVLTARPGSGGGGGGAVASSAASGSGGIGTASASAPRTTSGAGIGQRRTTTVESPVGFGKDLSKPGQDGIKRLAGRTLEEIQLIFDRNKASFYSLFNRALRETPGLRGKMVVSLTIAPNGSVTACDLVSSELGDPELERKVIQRVLLLNFGAKDVPAFTYPNYPIYFLPS